MTTPVNDTVDLSALDSLNLDEATANAEKLRDAGGEVVTDEADCEGCKI